MLFALIIIIVGITIRVTQEWKFQEKAVKEKNLELKAAYEKTSKRYGRQVKIQLLTYLILVIVFILLIGFKII